jgi:hypothetical protein
MKPLFVVGLVVSLANCYFAHNSLEFPVLLGFCDARSPSRGKRDGL